MIGGAILFRRLFAGGEIWGPESLLKGMLIILSGIFGVAIAGSFHTPARMGAGR